MISNYTVLLRARYLNLKHFLSELFTKGTNTMNLSANLFISSHYVHHNFIDPSNDITQY